MSTQHEFTGVRCCVANCDCRECKRCGWVRANLQGAPCEAVQNHKRRKWLEDNLLACVSTRFSMHDCGGFTVKMWQARPIAEAAADMVITIAGINTGRIVRFTTG